MINFTCPNCHEDNAYLVWSDVSTALYNCDDCDFEWTEVDASLQEENEALQNLKLLITEKVKDFLNEVLNNSDLKNESPNVISFAREYLFQMKFKHEDKFPNGLFLELTHKKENTFSRIYIHNKGIDLTEGFYYFRDSDEDFDESIAMCIPPKIIWDSVDYSKKIDDFLIYFKEDLLNPDMDIIYFS
jgi:Zn ribbon nucleic-acid-binding protein